MRRSAHSLVSPFKTVTGGNGSVGLGQDRSVRRVTVLKGLTTMSSRLILRAELLTHSARAVRIVWELARVLTRVPLIVLEVVSLYGLQTQSVVR